MNFAAPQTLNRYAYVNNSPLSAADRSGLIGEGGSGAANGIPCYTAVTTGGRDLYGDLGCAWFVGNSIRDVLHYFERPRFRGSLTPRPNARIWDEHGSYSPKAAGISDLLGLPSGGCEFGACGFQQSGSVPNVGVNCRGIETDHLGLILAQHCDATVSIGDGWLYSVGWSHWRPTSGVRHQDAYSPDRCD